MRQVTLPAFRTAASLVTVAALATFIAAIDHVPVAERAGRSSIFAMTDGPVNADAA